jgi:hypothetical protein
MDLDVNEPTATSLATVFVASDIGKAQVVRATLEAEGIACVIPDVQMASLGWHLGNVIAGIRVQVAEADVERARELLATLEGATPAASDPEEASEAVSAQADRAAAWAWRLSVLGFGMWPIFHPYALVLGLRALKAPGLSQDGRKRARLAIRTSIVAMVAFVALIAAVSGVFR